MKKVVSLILCMIMLIASVCTTSFAALAESDLIGVWNAISAEADGMTMDKSMLEMFGMLIKMTFNEDGTGILEMEGEAGEINWSESAETVEISVEGDSMTMNKNADGTLAGDFGGTIIVFEKGDGSETEPAEMSEEEQMMALLAMLAAAEGGEATEGGLPGVWNAVSAESEGMILDKDMLEMFGMLIELTLNEDGTGSLAMEGEAGEITWSEGDGVVSIFVEGDSMDMTMNDDGTLSGDFGGAIIVFEKGNGAAEAAPAADVDTAALLGTWFDGDTTNFTIYNDGTCVATDQYGDSWMDWEVVDGVPMITSGFWFDSPMILNEDGTLYVSDGWSVEKTFTYGEGEIRVGSTLAEPTGTVAASSAEEFFGEWKGETMVMESGTFALADMMMVMDLTISADGTVALFDGAMTDTATWTYADGYMTAADGMIELSLMDNGQLCMAQEFNILYLSRADGSAASVEAPADPAESAASAEAFVGTWVSEFYKLELYEDGTGKYFYPDGTYDDKVWVVKGAGIEFTDLWWNGSTAVIDADGALNVDAGWYVFQSENSSAEVPVEPEASAEVPAEAMMLIGEWTKLDNGNMLNVNADGTVVLTYASSGNVENMTWAVENGVVVVTSGLYEYYEMTVNEDDILEIGLFEFGRVGEPYVAPAPAEFTTEAPEASDDPYVGAWKACYLATGGLTGDLRSLGITSTLTLNADGTGSIDFPTPETGVWYDDEGIVRFGEAGMPMTLMDGGFLKFGSDLAGYIVFSQDEAAVWDPSMAAPAAPAATEAPAAPAAPAESMTDLNARMERKFVAKTYTSFGQTMDASMLGAEYSVLFHENGTCDFGLAGMVVPNLPWGLQKVATGLTEVDAFVINYYGTMFNAMLTETGFDMDYYGTMTLHFVSAE